jgi:hypothetical protein
MYYFVPATGGSGIHINTTATVHITGTTVRNNTTGIWIDGGIVGVSNVKALYNFTGILMLNTSNNGANATVVDSVVSHNIWAGIAQLPGWLTFVNPHPGPSVLHVSHNEVNYNFVVESASTVMAFKWPGNGGMTELSGGGLFNWNEPYRLYSAGNNTLMGNSYPGQPGYFNKTVVPTLATN